MHECVKCGGRDDLVEQDVGIPSHYCPDYPPEEEYAIGVKEAAKEGTVLMCSLCVRYEKHRTLIKLFRQIIREEIRALMP